MTLKPCPFCGEKASQWSTEDSEWVQCNSCLTSSDVYPLHSGKLETLWNTRPTELAAYKAGMEAAAKIIQKRAEAYDSAYGFTDPETGTREYPPNGDEYMNDLAEIKESIQTARDNTKEI